MYPHCTTQLEWATPLPVSSPLATLPVTVATSGDIGGWGVLTSAVGAEGGSGKEEEVVVVPTVLHPPVL